MSLRVSSRKVAALAVAASGLATVLSGAFAPTASAATTAPTAATAVVTVTSSWFVDPRTPAQRRAEVAVPRKPKAYRGRLQETRAVYRTHAGALAVPMRFAFGHQVAEGQALTLDGRALFPRGSSKVGPVGKAQIRRLASSLSSASRVRCEGYSDYSGRASKARSLSEIRAAKVCRRLAAANPGLRTSSVGYGSRRPVMVGGTPRQRHLNRRVVVEMTGTRPTTTDPQSQVPGAPVLAQVTGVDQGVYFGFAAPASDGGSPITGYQVSTGTGWEAVQPLPGGSQSPRCRGACDEDLIYASLAGLTAGTTVELRVRAVNVVGAGGPSNARSATVFGRPTAPTDLTVVGDDGTLTATFGAPEQDGGSGVVSYEISYDGGEHWSAANVGPSEPYTVTKTGLDNGTTYDVRVRATNQWGHGPAASLETLVATVPGAPTLEQPELDGTSARVVFAAPESDGGSVITSYQLSSDGGDTWRALAFSEVEPSVYETTLADLTFGESYDVRVRAVNARGHGPASTTRTVAPATVPDAPTDVVATADGTDVEITFDAPAFDGGSAITGYQVRVDDGDWSDVILGNGSTFTLSDQTAGTHTYAVRAVNAAGPSPAGESAPVEVVVALAPPTVLSHDPAPWTDRIRIAWTVGSAGPLTVTGWQISLDGGAWQTLDVYQTMDDIRVAQILLDCAGTPCSTVYTTAELRAVTADGFSETSPVHYLH